MHILPHKRGVSGIKYFYWVQPPCLALKRYYYLCERKSKMILCTRNVKACNAIICISDTTTFQILETPSSVRTEIDTLDEKFSNIYSLSGTFPPDFYEKLQQRQQEYQVSS